MVGLVGALLDVSSARLVPSHSLTEGPMHSAHVEKEGIRGSTPRQPFALIAGTAWLFGVPVPWG